MTAYHMGRPQLAPFINMPSSCSPGLQRSRLCISRHAHTPSCSRAADEHDDLPLDECTLIWRKHLLQPGLATEEEMQTFFLRRGKRACELSDEFSHLIGPRFNLVSGLERFRDEVYPDDVAWDNEEILLDNKNECIKLLKAGDCVEEVFDQSFHELGRNALQCLGVGKGRLMEGIPHFVEDVKEGRLLIPKHSKVALDSSLIVYLLQPAGTVNAIKKESLLSLFQKASFLQSEGSVFAQKKEILLHVLSKPFFFSVSEFSISTDIPSGMLGQQSPQPTKEERKKLCTAWKSFINFFIQYATVMFGERGSASVKNLLNLLKCNRELWSSSYRGKVLLDTIGPEAHLMLVGDYRYHGRMVRGIREGTMHTILMWCPFMQDIVYYHQDGSVIPED